MNKGWIIGCSVAGVLGIGACAGLVALVFFGAFGLTRPVVAASDAFLDRLGQGKVAEAYASTAGGLRDQQDEASFGSAVKYVGLADCVSVSWHRRARMNRDGSVEGTVTTRDGKTRAVALRLAEEAGMWKVAAVRCRGIDLAEVPPEADLRGMATEVLLEFNKAVKAGDFTQFHARTSAPWKKQITPQKMQEAFQKFIDNHIDIGAIKEVEPRFDPPAPADEDGVLVVKGHYPTRPSQVHYTLEYLRESGAWKLLGIHVNVGEDK
jgi:hypothetical protein